MCAETKGRLRSTYGDALREALSKKKDDPLQEESPFGAPANPPRSDAKDDLKQETKRKIVNLGSLTADGSTLRFYRKVGVEAVEDGWFAVTLGGRKLITPAGKLFKVQVYFCLFVVSF